MSTYQTKSGLWVQGNQPQPATNSTKPQAKRQPVRRQTQKQATGYDPQTGAAYRWPPKLSQAAWFIAAPLILGGFGLLGLAICFIANTAQKIFF